MWWRLISADYFKADRDVKIKKTQIIFYLFKWCNHTKHQGLNISSKAFMKSWNEKDTINVPALKSPQLKIYTTVSHIYYCILWFYNYSALLPSCVDGERLHPEQHLPRRLCSAQRKRTSAPYCPDACPRDSVKPPRPSSHRLLPLTVWPATANRHCYWPETHNDWSSLIETTTNKAEQT